MDSWDKNIEIKIINGLRKGSLSSFQRLFEIFSKPLFQFCLNYLKSAEEAEDVVQEVFLKVWEKRETIVINSSFKSYLFTIALNSVRKHFIQLAKENQIKHDVLIELSVDRKKLEVQNDYQDLLLLLENSIKKMPSRRREVFLKKKIEGKSLKEIAEELGIKSKTVEYHITEAMKFLKVEFKRKNISGLVFFALFIQEF